LAISVSILIGIVVIISSASLIFRQIPDLTYDCEGGKLNAYKYTAIDKYQYAFTFQKNDGTDFFLTDLGLPFGG
jgi:hypothetical protein